MEFKDRRGWIFGNSWNTRFFVDALDGSGVGGPSI